MDVCFIELEDVLFFYEEEMKHAGSSGWIRDQFELEACIEAPKHTFDGEYLLDLYGMAAKYVASFAIRHPFSDGNKRMGAVSAVVFLEANGINYIEKNEGDLAEIVLSYLRNECTEESIREHFKNNSITTG